MKIVTPLVWLLFSLIKGLVISGWETAMVILQRPNIRSGFTHMQYGELDPFSAVLVGALISLTPGTTTVAIDLSRREFLLHLLDMEGRDATIAAIRSDFIRPLLKLHGRSL